MLGRDPALLVLPRRPVTSGAAPSFASPGHPGHLGHPGSGGAPSILVGDADNKPAAAPADTAGGVQSRQKRMAHEGPALSVRGPYQAIPRIGRHFPDVIDESRAIIQDPCRSFGSAHAYPGC